MPASNHLLLLVLLVRPLACAEEIEDYGLVCVEPVMVEDEWVLRFEANSGDCASDHRRAEFSCSVAEDAQTGDVVISTLYKPGRDPDDSCADPLFAECEFVVGSEPGTATARFADDVLEVAFPGDPLCFY